MKLRHLIILITLLTAVVPQLVFSQGEEKYIAKITPVKGVGFSMMINDFSRETKFKYFDVQWKGSEVSLMFNEIKIIRYIKPNLSDDAEITFKDGRKDVFKVPWSFVTGRSKYGPWKMHLSDVVEIEFIFPETHSVSTPVEINEFDRVVLKNGDTISGQIKNGAFTLRTFYGIIKFDTERIQNINFEVGGQNIDVVILRIGDKLSGVIQENNVVILTRSGAEIALEKDKVKDINFKK